MLRGFWCRLVEIWNEFLKEVFVLSGFKGIYVMGSFLVVVFVSLKVVI